MNLRGSMGVKLKLLQDHMLLSNLVNFPLQQFLSSYFQYCHSDVLLFLFFPYVDTFIQKTKKLYLDTRTQRNMAKLNDELYEVHQIMTRNVQEVLGVGEKLDRKLTYSFTSDVC